MTFWTRPPATPGTRSRQLASDQVTHGASRWCCVQSSGRVAHRFLWERVGPPACDRRVGNLLPELSALVVYEEVRRADLPGRWVDEERGLFTSQQGEPYALPAASLAQAGNTRERGQGPERSGADLRCGRQFGEQRDQRVEDVFPFLGLAGCRPAAGLGAVPGRVG